MQIRKIKIDDVDSLLDLYNHYVSKDNIPNLSQQTVEEIWDEISRNPCINYFVIELDNKIISSCILTITPSFIRGGKAYGVIEHVVVHKDYRRKGIAQIILKQTIEYAWQNECTEIMLLSGSNNENAHQLYRKLNFDEKRKKGFILFKP